MDNKILATDSYKMSHPGQYPAGMTAGQWYIEARANALYDKTVFFGLQYFVQKYMHDRFTMEEVDHAARVCKAHGVPFDYDGWKYIVQAHGGYLPLRVRAVAEGAPVEKGNAMVVVESTDERVFWAPGWLETQLVRAFWYGSSVATVSWEAKQVIREYLEKTSDIPEIMLPSRLHDFGARGVTCHEQAQIGGAAHLINFAGTDTMESLCFLEDWYGADITDPNKIPGYSIPAMEHSTVTSWGPTQDDEAASFVNMFDKYAGKFPFIACVSDSNDFRDAVRRWGSELKEMVVKSGTVLVVRPDSGDPVEMVIWALYQLAKDFGYEVNSKGYKVLKNVAVIQGDGMDLIMIRKVLVAIEASGFSTQNVAFGMGGGLLQKVVRDTQSVAMKLNAKLQDGLWHPVSKDPTDDPGKKSKGGLLDLRRDGNGKFYTQITPTVADSKLDVVYEKLPGGNSLSGRFQTFDDIRARSEKRY